MLENSKTLYVHVQNVFLDCSLCLIFWTRWMTDRSNLWVIEWYSSLPVCLMPVGYLSLNFTLPVWIHRVQRFIIHLVSGCLVTQGIQKAFTFINGTKCSILFVYPGMAWWPSQREFRRTPNVNCLLSSGIVLA